MKHQKLTPAVFAAWLCLGCGLSAVAVNQVRAQMDDDYAVVERNFRTPEEYTFELRLGPYVPHVGSNAFERAYPNDNGLMLGLELDYIVLRIPDILYVGPGFGFAWANYDGRAFQVSSSTRTDEKVDFTLFPLSLLAMARVDVLARKLNVPLIVAGKIGFRWNIWDSDKGGSDEKNGVTPSWTWAVQADLDLDFFDARAARIMDEEWGINHSYILFEVFGCKSIGDGMPVDDTTWTAGLGFIF